jgi:hypothetical protein
MIGPENEVRWGSGDGGAWSLGFKHYKKDWGMEMKMKMEMEMEMEMETRSEYMNYQWE